MRGQANPSQPPFFKGGAWLVSYPLEKGGDEVGGFENLHYVRLSRAIV
jgi:hypothetical protein